MENIKTKDLSSLLIEKEWLVLFVNADWCAHCQETKKHLPEIISSTPEIAILGVNAQDPDNMELLKGINLETLPYFAVFHTKKEDAIASLPMTCFVGGDTGDHNTLVSIISMIKQFQARDISA
jgi:thiol:disulfide interchange protein